MSFTVEVHHPVLPDVFWRATNDAETPVGGIVPAPWSKESPLSAASGLRYLNSLYLPLKIRPNEDYIRNLPAGSAPDAWPQSIR
jgi:hypothetical protein